MVRDYRNTAADKRYRGFTENPQEIPFSFVYDGVKYTGFSPEFFELKDKKVDRINDKETTTFIFGFAEVLNVSVILTHYFSHGATEWTVWFENISDVDSKIITKPETSLDFIGKQPVLKGILGDHVNQYRPYSHDITGGSFDFSSDTGRATHVNFPYFNLEYGDGGVMLAIGWAGTWHANFSSTGDVTTYTAGSVNNMNLYLKPGEKIRTALFAMAEYTVRNEYYATNFWRSWYVEHNLPKADKNGAMMEPFSTCCLAFDTGLPNSDGSISERYFTWKPSLEKMIEEDVKVDFRWFDAGWYVSPDGSTEEVDWWGTVGTWELDPTKWPGKTFLESTEFARTNGMKTLVWFEPERVTNPEALAENFGYNTDWAIRIDGLKEISNNIGIPECFEWTVERICKMLRENKVEMYREDNNCSASVLWSHLDGKEGQERTGITECKFIGGHYAMWDRIIECTLSYGGCGFVDSCASGGGRNDLESMRRGVPLLRSDSDRTGVSLRLAMTTALNKWLPFCGACSKEKIGEHDATGISDPYVWRASYLPALNVDSQFVQDPGQDFGILRFGLKEWKEVSPYLLKEFYVLTPWHHQCDIFDFTAMCYYDPDAEKGVLLAFRQEQCVRDSLKISLPFAEKGDKFIFTNKDNGEKFESEGKATLNFEHKREAQFYWIEKI